LYQLTTLIKKLHKSHVVMIETCMDIGDGVLTHAYSHDDDYYVIR